jgi:hypothetical protein
VRLKSSLLAKSLSTAAKVQSKLGRFHLSGCISQVNALQPSSYSHPAENSENILSLNLAGKYPEIPLN